MRVYSEHHRKLPKRKGLCEKFSLLFSSGAFVWWLKIVLLLVGCRSALADSQATAFFYAKPIPTQLLSRYDRVIIEAENFDFLSHSSKAEIYAYVSIGEAERWRAGYEHIDKTAFLKTNTGWNSDIVDLTHPAWRNYLLEKRMAVLWKTGYRAFFLDTLDSYQAVTRSPDEQKVQRTALTNLIKEIHHRFRGVKLLLNRGFEVLPEVADLIAGVAAESLFNSWDPHLKEYVTVSVRDRAWLTNQLNKAHEEHGLSVTVIDYLPPEERSRAIENARNIAALGFIPWISTPYLDFVGIGQPDIAEKP